MLNYGNYADDSIANADGRNVLTVSQLNEYVKILLENAPFINNIWVRGEISNFKHHYASGHFYFSLKDSGGVVSAVMFKGNASRLEFMPEDGMKVAIKGRISLYSKTGQYQLYADDMIPDGIGALYLAYEQLRKRLADEGLFDESRKRPLPRFPQKVGIITSDTGAAIRDMFNVLGRRYPLAEIELYPAQVQGSEAPAELAEGIEYFNTVSDKVDVIIIGRGGGSIEDLWAFNDERLARKIFSSHIPVISAVGHESDFTICDFVADKRAPTPSAAAELAVPNISDLSAILESLKLRSYSALKRGMENARGRVAYLAEKGNFAHPERYFDEKRMCVSYIAKGLDSAYKDKINESKNRLVSCSARLEVMSPLSVLSRGYAVVSKKDSSTPATADDIAEGDVINVRFCDGKAEAEIRSVSKT